MVIFSACDEGFNQLFGSVLMASAKANGFKCLIVSSEKWATDHQSRVEHSLFRYRVLPDVLRCHEAVLMLDTDSIVRGSFRIEPTIDIGVIYRPGKHPKHRVNGSAVYITQRSLPAALWLRDRLSGKEPQWYDDQHALRELVERQEYSFRSFDERFVNWHMDENAPIWTGKGEVKLSDKWYAEMQRWYPDAHRPLRGQE